MLPLNKHDFVLPFGCKWPCVTKKHSRISVEKGLVGLFQTTRPNKQGTFPETNIVPENKPSQKETSIPTIHLQVRAVGFKEGNMLSCRATWSHLYRRHFLFARHTLSQMSHAGLGLLLETVLVSFFTQLPWFLLRMLSLSDMSACRSCKVQAAKVDLLVGGSFKWSWRWSSEGRHPLHVWGQLGITGTDTQSVTCYQPQQGLLPGIPDSKVARCVIRAICCCLLAKKLKLTPFNKFSSSKRGLLTGTSWTWHIRPLHAWK